MCVWWLGEKLRCSLFAKTLNDGHFSFADRKSEPLLRPDAKDHQASSSSGSKGKVDDDDDEEEQSNASVPKNNKLLTVVKTQSSLEVVDGLLHRNRAPPMRQLKIIWLLLIHSSIKHLCWSSFLPRYYNVNTRKYILTKWISIHLSASKCRQGGNWEGIFHFTDLFKKIQETVSIWEQKRGDWIDFKQMEK